MWQFWPVTILKKLVPIKPICEALGIDRKAQQDKIREDEFLSSSWGAQHPNWS